MLTDKDSPKKRAGIIHNNFPLQLINSWQVFQSEARSGVLRVASARLVFSYFMSAGKARDSFPHCDGDFPFSL